jgi:protein-tyrosine phosphatase
MGGMLFVCTANQIRSPMAERLVVHRLERTFGPVADSVMVTSAGLRVAGPVPMHPQAQAELKRLGVHADGHNSTPLDHGAVARAHLVITATRAQRDEIIALVPSALPHTFTVVELAWLLQGLGSTDIPGRQLVIRVSRLAEVAQARRGHLRPLPPEEYDIKDPMGRGRREYRRAATAIENALTSILAVL